MWDQDSFVVTKQSCGNVLFTFRSVMFADFSDVSPDVIATGDQMKCTVTLNKITYLSGLLEIFDIMQIHNSTKYNKANCFRQILRIMSLNVDGSIIMSCTLPVGSVRQSETLSLSRTVKRQHYVELLKQLKLY